MKFFFILLSVNFQSERRKFINSKMFCSSCKKVDLELYEIKRRICDDGHIFCKTCDEGAENCAICGQKVTNFVNVSIKVMCALKIIKIGILRNRSVKCLKIGNYEDKLGYFVDCLVFFT